MGQSRWLCLRVAKVVGKTITFEQGLAGQAEGKTKTHDVAATVKDLTPMVNDNGQFVLRMNRNSKCMQKAARTIAKDLLEGCLS